jgi:hypothetical protein
LTYWNPLSLNVFGVFITVKVSSIVCNGSASSSLKIIILTL